VTLLGDAAHPMTPNMEQGACQAIEDAVALAMCITTAHTVASAYKRMKNNGSSGQILLCNNRLALDRLRNGKAHWQ
jgi:hypothetical protein